MVASDRGRAQLILVGSVSLALIIIGLSVVLNTVLFTSSMTADVTVDASENALEFDEQAREGVGGMVLRLNHVEQNVSEADLSRALQRNISGYAALLRGSYASVRPVYVNVSYNDHTFGERLTQVEDCPLVAPNGDDDWTPLPSGASSDVGLFVLNLNVSGMGNTAFNVTIANASGRAVDIAIRKVTGGGATEVVINSTRSYGPDTVNARCTAIRGRVLLDLMAGRAFNDDCQFNATGNMAPPYTVRIADGDVAHGTYSLVSNDDITGIPTLQSCPESGEPCTAPAVWSVNVTMRYAARQIDYRQAHNVSVYP